VKKQTIPSQDRALGKPRGSTTKKRQPTAADAKVGESIRAHRLIAGMSQSDLARQLGVSFQQVQKYEKGANRVGAGRLPQLARIFDIPISALFSNDADASPGSKTATAAPAKLITDPSVLRLLTSYASITDRVTRRRLSELVDGIARTAKKARR
jgi:transcriptional regulator with XRE-family HTH domain